MLSAQQIASRKNINTQVLCAREYQALHFKSVEGKLSLKKSVAKSRKSITTLFICLSHLTELKCRISAWSMDKNADAGPELNNSLANGAIKWRCNEIVETSVILLKTKYLEMTDWMTYKDFCCLITFMVQMDAEKLKWL